MQCDVFPTVPDDLGRQGFIHQNEKCSGQSQYGVGLDSTLRSIVKDNSPATPLAHSLEEAEIVEKDVPGSGHNYLWTYMQLRKAKR